MPKKAKIFKEKEIPGGAGSEDALKKAALGEMLKQGVLAFLCPNFRGHPPPLRNGTDIAYLIAISLISLEGLPVKKYLAFIFFVGTVLAPWACNRHVAVPTVPQPTATPTATSTPTVNLTPVCGMGLVSLPPLTFYIYASVPNPLRTLADWQTFCEAGGYGPSNIPAPPVDFSTQMIFFTGTPVCAPYISSICNVCEGPTQTVVTVNQRTLWYQCYVYTPYYASLSACSAPQYDQPVSWNVTNGFGCQNGVWIQSTPIWTQVVIPPAPIPTVTPTATP